MTNRVFLVGSALAGIALLACISLPSLRRQPVLRDASAGYYDQALAARLAGNRVEYETKLRLTLSSDPRHYNALIDLGELNRTTNPTRAESLFTAARERRPDGIEPYEGLVLIRLKQRDYPAVVELGRAGHAIDPTSEPVLRGLSAAAAVVKGDTWLDRLRPELDRWARWREEHRPWRLADLAAAARRWRQARSTLERFGDPASMTSRSPDAAAVNQRSTDHLETVRAELIEQATSYREAYGDSSFRAVSDSLGFKGILLTAPPGLK